MRSLLVRELLYHQSLFPSSQKLGIVPSHILIPVYWIVTSINQLDPLRLIPYQKNRDLRLGTSMRLGILSLLIILFVRLLDDYLPVMADIPNTKAFKDVLSTMMQLRL